MPRPSSQRASQAAKPVAATPKGKASNGVATLQPAQQKTDFGLWFFMGCLVLGAALFFRGSSLPFGDRIVPNPDDQKQVVPDDSKGKPAKYDLTKTFLVRVYETADMPNWLTLNVRNEIFWKDFVGEKFGSIDKLQTLDPMQGDKQNPEAESYVRAAKAKGISPPFWLHATDGGDVIQIGSMSESEGVEQIKAKILGVAK